MFAEKRVRVGEVDERKEGSGGRSPSPRTLDLQRSGYECFGLPRKKRPTKMRTMDVFFLLSSPALYTCTALVLPFSFRRAARPVSLNLDLAPLLLSLFPPAHSTDSLLLLVAVWVHAAQAVAPSGPRHKVIPRCHDAGQGLAQPKRDVHVQLVGQGGPRGNNVKAKPSKKTTTRREITIVCFFTMLRYCPHGLRFTPAVSPTFAGTKPLLHLPTRPPTSGARTRPDHPKTIRPAVVAPSLMGPNRVSCARETCGGDTAPKRQSTNLTLRTKRHCWV